METITIKIHYRGTVIDYTIEGEIVGDYAVHPIPQGKMFNGKLQHGPGYTISGQSGHCIAEFKSIDTALMCAGALSDFTTMTELERITFASNRNVADVATLNMAKAIVYEYVHQEKEELSK